MLFKPLIALSKLAHCNNDILDKENARKEKLEFGKGKTGLPGWVHVCDRGMWNAKGRFLSKYVEFV